MANSAVLRQVVSVVAWAVAMPVPPKRGYLAADLENVFVFCVFSDAAVCTCEGTCKQWLNSHTTQIPTTQRLSSPNCSLLFSSSQLASTSLRKASISLRAWHSDHPSAIHKRHARFDCTAMSVGCWVGIKSVSSFASRSVRSTQRPSQTHSDLPWHGYVLRQPCGSKVSLDMSRLATVRGSNIGTPPELNDNIMLHFVDVSGWTAVVTTIPSHRGQVSTTRELIHRSDQTSNEFIETSRLSREKKTISEDHTVALERCEVSKLNRSWTRKRTATQFLCRHFHFLFFVFLHVSS